MNTDKVRHFLNGYRVAFNEYEDILDRLYRSGNIEPQSPMLTGMPRSGKVADLSDRLILSLELVAMYKERLHELRAKMKEVRKVIEAIPDETNKAIMTYKYIDLMNWNDISEALKLDKDLMYQRHKRTLEQIAEVLPWIS